MLFQLLVLLPCAVFVFCIVAVGYWQTRHLEYAPLTYPLDSDPQSSNSSFRRRIFVASVMLDRLLVGLVMTFEGIARDLLWFREILVGFMDLEIRNTTQAASSSSSSSSSAAATSSGSVWMRRAMNLLQTQRRVSARVQGHYVRELVAEQIVAHTAAATSTTPGSAPSTATLTTTTTPATLTLSPPTTEEEDIVQTTAAPWEDGQSSSEEPGDGVSSECIASASVAAIDDFLESR